MDHNKNKTQKPGSYSPSTLCSGARGAVSVSGPPWSRVMVKASGGLIMRLPGPLVQSNSDQDSELIVSGL